MGKSAWRLIDRKSRRTKVPEPYCNEFDKLGLRHAVRFHECLNIWPWELLPQHNPQIWERSLLENLAFLARDAFLSQTTDVEELRSELVQNTKNIIDGRPNPLTVQDVRVVRRILRPKIDKLVGPQHTSKNLRKRVTACYKERTKQNFKHTIKEDIEEEFSISIRKNVKDIGSDERNSCKNEPRDPDAGKDDDDDTSSYSDESEDSEDDSFSNASYQLGSVDEPQSPQAPRSSPAPRRILRSDAQRSTSNHITGGTALFLQSVDPPEVASTPTLRDLPILSRSRLRSESPPSQDESRETKRRKVDQASTTDAASEESLSQIRSGVDAGSLRSIALMYSNKLIEADKLDVSLPAPSNIHKAVLPAVADFVARLNHLISQASQALEESDSKLQAKIAKVQECQELKIRVSKSTIDNYKQTLLGEQRRHAALTTEANEMAAMAASLQNMGDPAGSRRLPQLQVAINAYNSQCRARLDDAAAQQKSIDALLDSIAKVEVVHKENIDQLPTMNQEVMDLTKEWENKKADLDVLKNIAVMVMTLERTIPGLEELARS